MTQRDVCEHSQHLSVPSIPGRSWQGVKSHLLPMPCAHPGVCAAQAPWLALTSYKQAFSWDTEKRVIVKEQWESWLRSPLLCPSTPVKHRLLVPF